ncbi:hypothetical protein [Flavobacterium sp.]|uniref:hypothetical protein n=1 Tax=Flavobacterium sp. TaxID=239 RepID=UPI0025ED52FC|nr:hypothetical protein [Flavobacterium sp.]
MKIRIVILMLLSLLKVSGQCELKSTYDKFKKSTLFRTENISVYNGKEKFQIMLLKDITEKDAAYALGITVEKTGCITRKSYMQFLTDKSNIIELKYVLEVDCGTSSALFLPTESQLKELLNSNITDIRIYFDYTFDLELNEEMKNKIKEVLTCILNAKT